MGPFILGGFRMWDWIYGNGSFVEIKMGLCQLISYGLESLVSSDDCKLLLYSQSLVGLRLTELGSERGQEKDEWRPNGLRGIL